jgi:regulatory protein
MTERRSKRLLAAADLTEAWVHEAIVSYLNRYDATSALLRERIVARVRERLQPGLDASERHAVLERVSQLADEVLSRLQGSGVVDDSRFARELVRSLRERGASAKVIRERLRGRRVAGEVIEAALEASAEETQQSPELAAALKFVRRRRLGPHRPRDLRQAMLKKDLGALARAGFDFSTASQALGAALDGEEFD